MAHSAEDTPARKAAIVEAAKKEPSLTAAAKAAGVSGSVARTWKYQDEEFAAALEEARQEYRDTLREVAFERATGFWRPVLYKGAMTPMIDPHTGEVMLNPDGTIRYLMEKVHSDQVLIKLMEAELPEHRRAKGGGIGVEIGGGEGNKPTRIIVQFQDPPDWDNVEWGEDGRPVLKD